MSRSVADECGQIRSTHVSSVVPKRGKNDRPRRRTRIFDRARGEGVKPRVDFCPDCGAQLVQRTTAQNALLHSYLGQLAKQRQWAGHWLSIDDWKRLLTAAHCRAQKEHVRIVPALDGQGFDVLYRRTSRMAKKEMIDLLTYAEWWAGENGVWFREWGPQQQRQASS